MDAGDQHRAPAIPGSSRASSARAAFRSAERARRRYERGEVRRFTRRTRRRRLGVAVAIVVVGALVGLVAAAVFSPLLALRTVTVDGTSRLDAPTLASAVGDQLGTPLALLDYGKITSELGAFPLIRSYVTEIVPPGTLLIHVTEREPIGVLKTATGFDLVDPAGIVIDSTPTRPAGVPLITLDAAGIGGPGFTSMAEVLLALPPTVLPQVDGITAQTKDDVTLTLTGGQRVVWGSASDSARKAQVLATLLALHGGGGAGQYDVSAPGSAVFRPN